MTERDFREIISEDGKLTFNFVPPPKKLPVAKVASLLWMNPSTQQEIMNLFHSGIYSAEKWDEIKDHVVDKISELCLPHTIVEMLAKAIPALGDSILQWIEYHDRFTSKSYFENSKYSAADLITHIIWSDLGKIDLSKTAKNILANSDNLNDDQKYKIACTYCLEDEIAILAPKVLNRDYLDCIDIDLFPMVYFWTSYITGDNIKLYNHYNDYIQHFNDNMSVNEYLMDLLTYKNPVPIMYVWNKLNEQEKARHLTPLVKSFLLEQPVVFYKQDLRYSLLPNLDHDQQRNILNECSGLILVGILNDWLLEDYFLQVAFHVLEIMDAESYENTLCALIDKIKRENNRQNKDYFKIFWQRSSRHLKDYIFDNWMASFLCYSFSWESDTDLMDFIFKDASNPQQKKQIIFDEDCIEKCSEFIQNDEWSFLKLLMNYTLSSEEDIIEFKETLVRFKGDEIAFTYLVDEAYDEIKPFLDWAFKSKEEEDHFRQTLVTSAGSIMHSIVKDPNLTLTRLENYFAWCANGDLELINRFKSEILIEKSYFIRKLIKEDQHEVLDQLLNWCYLGNQQQIAQFRRNIADYDDDMDVYH